MAPRQRRSALEVPQRAARGLFRIVPDIDPAVYDDPTFVLTITVQTASGKGVFSTHTGPPGGKSRRWALGLRGLGAGSRVSASITTNKPCEFGAAIEED